MCFQALQGRTRSISAVSAVQFRTTIPKPGRPASLPRTRRFPSRRLLPRRGARVRDSLCAARTVDTVSRCFTITSMNTQWKTLHRRGENHPGARLRESEVCDIRARLAHGYSLAYIARLHDVSIGTVRAIRDGVTWKHVPA